MWLLLSCGLHRGFLLQIHSSSDRYCGLAPIPPALSPRAIYTGLSGTHDLQCLCRGSPGRRFLGVYQRGISQSGPVLAQILGSSSHWITKTIFISHFLSWLNPSAHTHLYSLLRHCGLFVSLGNIEFCSNDVAPLGHRIAPVPNCTVTDDEKLDVFHVLFLVK